MTDNDNEFDNLEDAIADHLRNRPPDDVVPRRGLDRDAILALNNAAGTQVPLHEGGEMTTDPEDGTPTGVEQIRTSEPTMGVPIISRAQLERAGLTPEEVPNVRVV